MDSASAASIAANENVARPLWVYEVSKKSTSPPSCAWETFSRYASARVTAPRMVGSSSGFRPNVLAKQPASEASIEPSAFQATKSSCTGSEPFWRVNVVVVLPVPERPTISTTRSPWSVGMSLQPACSGSPPRSWTRRFHMRRPPFLDSPK